MDASPKRLWNVRTLLICSCRAETDLSSNDLAQKAEDLFFLPSHSKLVLGKFEEEEAAVEEAADAKTSSKSASKDNSLHAQLSRYLLKTLGTEVTNALFNLAAADVLTKVWGEVFFLG